ncbi:MAG: DUF1844 domain-containing protein [Acidobacteria bacterium]|nr:DUF1844 domain-containing protein [Acidobacteriota bacterium]
MPSRKEEEPEEFKVVDRRLFTSEGELRTDLPPEPPKPEPPPEPPPSSAKAAPPPSMRTSTTVAPTSERTAPAEAQPGSGSTPGGHGAVQFEHLIMSLVTSAMYQLGMAARPGEAPPPPDLPAAQETIDLLALLQVKTKGNLTGEEDLLLADSLSELRLAFVELSRRAGRIR